MIGPEVNREPYDGEGDGAGGATPHPPGGGHGGSGPTGLGAVAHAHASTPASATAPTTSRIFLMSALLTGTASVAAFMALAWSRRDRQALGYLTGIAGLMFVYVLFQPADWTPEAFVASESALAVLSALVGIGASRRARTRPDVLFAALCLALAAGAGGWIANHHVPLLRNYAYRGTAFLDLATCALLATIAGRSVMADRLDSIATRWLALCFGLSALRLLMFEVHFGLGRMFGWLQSFAWIGCMLLIASTAISRPQDAEPR